MRSILGMHVQVDEQQLVFTRTLQAPRQLVWDAWTTAEHLQAWWGPDGFTNRDCSVDLRVGGTFLITMIAPSGDAHPVAFTYEELLPIEKFVWISFMASQPAEPGHSRTPSARLTLLLEEQGAYTKTTLIWWFANNELRDQRLADGSAEGWAQMFVKLDNLVAHKPKGAER